MRYSILGSSGENVSRVCLGTMTWGEQNSQHDANQQLDYALSRGINFIDTAEVYSVPNKPETYGATETYIGNWLAENLGRRSEIFLASKVAGRGRPHVRGGGPITGEAVIAAVDNSLRRLQTDYIDLYQLHWPNRPHANFGRHHVGDIAFTPVDVAAERSNFLEVLQALQSCQQAGKIRYCGLSDESPWGVTQYLKLSETHSLPRMVSLQNEFSLLQTRDWPYMIEQCVMENIAYLPWSPLAGGSLSGKYLNGARPEGSRWTLPELRGVFRDTENVRTAVSAYKAIAEEIGITSAQLALAWVNQVDGVTSTIIGATSLTQLKDNIDAFDIELSADTLRAIKKVVTQIPVAF